MKASEIVALLQAEIERRGDREVLLHGCYGASESTFEIMKDENVYKDDRDKINVWTAIMTG